MGNGNRAEVAHDYVAPECSYFYYRCLSPLCDEIVTKLIPRWVHPDALTTLGLITALAAFVAILHEYRWTCIVLWWIYAIADNCDGKQARRLGVSSKAGEYYDHAIDSVVASVASYPILLSLTPPTNEIHKAVLSKWCNLAIILLSVSPYFVGTVAQCVHGKMLFGMNPMGSGGGAATPQTISVDEYNIFILPAFILCRIFFADLLDEKITLLGAPAWLDTFISFLLRVEAGSATTGMVILAIFLYPICGFLMIRHVWHLWLPRGRIVTIGFAIWAITVAYYKVHPIAAGSIFTIFTIQIMVRRLGIHSRHPFIYLTALMLLLPVVVLGNELQSDSEMEGPLEVVFGNSFIPLSYGCLSVFSCATLAILFAYKKALHTNSTPKQTAVTSS